MKKILVISPHADDETLGAGGFLLKHRDLMDEIYWVNVTNAKVEYGYTQEEEQQGEQEVSTVALAYHVKKHFDLGLEPAGLDKYSKQELIGMLSHILKETCPNIVILPFPGDVHSDHKIVFEAAYSCTKAFRYPFVEKVMCMEIISETDYAISDRGFVPNYFVDISEYIDEKVCIMKNYKNEIKDAPFPRNEDAMRGMARYRGAACNVNYAEAFRIIKEIEK